MRADELEVPKTLEGPVSDSIATPYYNQVYREYCMLQAVREIAKQLIILNKSMGKQS